MIQSHQTTDQYTIYDHCRICGSFRFTPVIDLGKMPLAGGFFPAHSPELALKNEQLYPLRLCFCEDCFLLQTDIVINRDTLFKNYFYHASAIQTLRDHFSELARDLVEVLLPENSFIVEIGANDGPFISALLDHDYKCLGVDPAHNIVIEAQQKGLPIIEAYFSEKTANKIVPKYGKADAIFSFNTLAHIEDMNNVGRGISILLKDDGMLVFEVHYLGSVLEDLQYDMIYHEHQYYYSLLTLQKFFAQHDMEVYGVEEVETHAGSLRVFVQKKKTGKRPIDISVKNLVRQELSAGYDQLITYQDYNQKMSKTKTDLISLLEELKAEGKSIAGYGASGRGTIVSNYCGLDSRFLDYIVDDAPAKKGVITPGVHLTVHTSEILMQADRPDYCLLLAWSFWEEIKSRNQSYLDSGGKFILPLPEVKIIE